MRATQKTLAKQPMPETAARVSGDLVIEDDIDTELSLAGWSRGQQLAQPILAAQRSPGAAAQQHTKTSKGLSSAEGKRVANKLENESPQAQLDIVLFPPVRHRRLESNPAALARPPLPPLAQQATPQSHSNKLPELPPLPAIRHGSGKTKNSSESRNSNSPVHATDAETAASSMNSAALAVSRRELHQQPTPPSKLSLDRPWWKSVNREQQALMLAATAAVQPPPQPKTEVVPAPEATAVQQQPLAEEPQLVGPPPMKHSTAASLAASAAASESRLWSKEAIKEGQIEALRIALFGNGDSRFSPDWASQGFHFGFDLIPYLLTSTKLETRVALNIVQGELIRQLLFVKASSDQQSAAEPAHRLNKLAKLAKSIALAKSFGRIVARCGSTVKIVLPNPAGVSHIDNFSYVKDGISETLDVYTGQSGCDVSQFLINNSRCFESQRTPSLVLLLYSCLLTLGVDRPGYTPPEGSPWPLIGPDNLANQSLLSLLLCGSPVASVGNNGEDHEEGVAGIPGRCDIGMLSQREFATRRSPEPHRLGSFLKSPRCPVWLVDLGQRGHACLAFALDAKLVSDWRAERFFELLLTSPELRARSPGRVVVDCRGNPDGSNAEDESSEDGGTDSSAESDHGDASAVTAGGSSIEGGDDRPPEMSPIEMSIRSKWPGAQIEVLQNVN